MAARLLTITSLLVLALAFAHEGAARQSPAGGASSSPRPERRTALVIGNAAYKDGPLRNPVNDAGDMRQALAALGFEVIYKENAGQNDMKRAIRAFGEKLRGGGVGVFYYAGHGVQLRGENYLIPVDAEVNSEEDVEYEAVNAGFVLAQMEAARNGTNVVILDACRNNPFARSWRSPSRGLALMSAPGGTLIAYATAPGRVAADGGQRNGVYTQELLKHMRTPSLVIEEVLKRVRVSVSSLTAGEQVPWESSSLTGNFYFVPPAGGVSSDTAGSRPAAANAAGPDFEHTLKGVMWLEHGTTVEGAQVFREFMSGGKVRTRTPKDMEGYVAGNVTWYMSGDTIYYLTFTNAFKDEVTSERQGVIRGDRIEGSWRYKKADGTWTTTTWLLTKVIR